MQYVFNSGRFYHLRNLFVIITIRLKRNLVYANLYMFAEFLSMFLTKEFVNPKGMFHKVCRQHPFEFLITLDLCRE